jgi:hypothetical protein
VERAEEEGSSPSNAGRHCSEKLGEGRFKSTVIEAEKYLLEVIRYLHLNPVVLGKERQWSAGNVCESTAGAATGVNPGW